MSVSFQQLEAFVWVAYLGSFRKAAEKLYTTQPAISARIAKLEDTLGELLFERTASTVRLTSKGLDLIPYAERTLKTVDLMKERSGNPSSLTGILRLGVSETIVHTILPHFLAQLYRKYPNIDVEIIVDITVNLKEELESHSIDLAFLLGPINNQGIENLNLASFELTWVAAKKHQIFENKSISISDVTKFPITTYSRKTRPFNEIYQYMQKYAPNSVRMFPSSSLAACFRMAADGIAVASVPSVLAGDVLSEHGLESFTCDWKPSNLEFTASYRAVPFNNIAEKAASLAHEVGIELQRKGGGYASGRSLLEI